MRKEDRSEEASMWLRRQVRWWFHLNTRRKRVRLIRSIKCKRETERKVSQLCRSVGSDVAIFGSSWETRRIKRKPTTGYGDRVFMRD